MNRSFALAFVVLSACGDDGTTAQPDAAVTPVPQALVVTGDYDATGVMTRLDLTTLEVAQNIGGTGAVSGDPVIRRVKDRVYIINRLSSNNITVFDATTLAFIDQFSAGANSNPQDVAVVGTALYVPAMGTTGVVKIDTTTGTATTIDLSSLDIDTRPDCVSAYAVDGLVYVSCSLLDENFSARGPGKVAVIDSATDTLATTVTLPTSNPYNFIERAPVNSVFAGDLLIPLLPSFYDFSTGCVARLTPGAAPTATCAAGLSNSALGGTVVHLDVSPDQRMLWMAISTVDSSFQNPTGKLKGFNLLTGELQAGAVSPSSQLVSDAAACTDGSVVVVDKTMNAAGLRVYRNNVEVTTAALPIGMPPTFGNALICYDAAHP